MASRNGKLGGGAIALIVPFVISLPWMLRNQWLYGDPFAIKAFNAAFVGSPKAADFISGVGAWSYWTDWVGWWTARSFVGMFGIMDVWLMEASGQVASDTVYRLILALLLVPAVAWAFGLRTCSDGPSKAFHITGAVLLGVVALLFVRFNMQYFQGQARYVYPAVAPIMVGLGFGLCHLLGGRREWAWAWAAGFLAVIQVLAVKALTDAF